MKTSSYYASEILRRSGERIQARRRTQKHILAFCIPFVFCLAVGGTLLLPKTGTGYSAPLTNGEMITAEAPTESAPILLDRIEIEKSASSLSLTDPDIPARFTALMQDLSAEEPDGSVPEVSEGTQALSGAPGTPETATPVIFHCIYTDGTTVRFTLQGDRLISGDHTFTLTEDQTESLLAMLGLQ